MEMLLFVLQCGVVVVAILTCLLVAMFLLYGVYSGIKSFVKELKEDRAEKKKMRICLGVRCNSKFNYPFSSFDSDEELDK